MPDVTGARFTARRIWDAAPHAAFADLAFFQSRWYCVFREGSGHAGSVGSIRLLVSQDFRAWRSVRRFAQRGVDLRDPKLSVTPDGRLMLLCGGTVMRGGKPVSRRPRVAFSPDGAGWSPFRRILETGDWLWRVSWSAGTAYGVSYRLLAPRRWVCVLFAGTDGVHFDQICTLKVTGLPNETALAFGRGGRLTALVRREGGDRRAWIGTSLPPYRAWTWRPFRYRVGGPCLLVADGGRVWVAARIVRRDGVCVALMPLDHKGAMITLPSGGDCGYPGMVLHRGAIRLCYYASHEGKSAIYTAEIPLP